MKVKRTIFIVVGVLVVLVAAAIILFLTNINDIVKAAIEKYGSEATKTAVRVSAVDIRLRSGMGAIRGLSIGNPKGFSAPYAIRFGELSTRIDTGSVTADPIVIDEIKISGPAVFYEMNEAGTSNVDVLKKNLQQSAGSTPKTEPKEKKTGGKEKKFLIKKLIIEQGRIDVRIAALGDKTKTATLKRIEMRNIGAGGGATPAQIAQQVLTTMVNEVGTTVGKEQVQKQIDKSIDKAMKRLLDKSRK